MKKHHFYKLLVSASLLTSVTTASLVASPIAHADSGTFVVGGNPINVRREPSTSGEVVAQYSPGQVVEYDSIVTGDGYRWISYIGGSGNRNYIAIGTADGSQSFGALNGSAPAPTPSPNQSSSGFKSEKGTFTVGSDVINVRREPSTNAEVVAQYNPGDKVNYDQIGISNGYRWISYVGSSGNRNYVAIGTEDGSQSFGSLSGASSTPNSSYDFSKIAGRYTNSNGSFVINADGTMSSGGYSYKLLGAGEPDSEGVVSFGFSYTAENGPTVGGGGIMTFIPAGVEGGQPNSDSSRDRVYVHHGPGVQQSDAFAYRDGSSTPSPKETPKTEETTPAGDFSMLAGKWVNKLGEEVSITKDGIVTQYGYNYVEYTENDGKVVRFDKRLVGPGEPKNGIYFGMYESGRRFNNYYVFSPAGTTLYDQFRKEDYGVDNSQDRLILVRAETGPNSTPIEEFLFTRKPETKKEETKRSSSSSSSTRQSSSSTGKTETSPSSSIKTETSTSMMTSSSQVQAPPKTQKQANPIQSVYKTLTGRKDLPSTGESVSVLGLVGLGIIGLAGVIKKRRHQK